MNTTMTSTTITSEAGRQIKVRAWTVDAREVLADLRSGAIQTARDLGIAFLSAKRSLATMAATEYGDSQTNNFALNAFENALDWSLGLATLDVIRAAVKARKLPKPFQIAATGRGQVYAIFASGRTARIR